MNRREFLGAVAVAPIAVRGLYAIASRTFEIVTKIELDESHDGGAAWVPLPSDVRKVILEEKKAPSDPDVAKARETLFGSWEGNWIAFNDAHDIVLPGAKGKPLPFLMYPQAEVGGDPLDSLDPEHFKYTITAREL